MAIRPGQRAQGPRFWQQERAGRAGTAGTGRNRDRLTEGGGAAEVLPYRGGGGDVLCLVFGSLIVEVF